MHIGIDALHLFGAYSGVHYALTRLAVALRKEYPNDRLTLYVPRDFAASPGLEDGEDPGLRIRPTWFPGRWRGVRTLWRNFRLQPWAYADRCDLLHGATYALPSALSMPAVLTVHDVIALSHPQFCTPGSARMQRRSLPRSIGIARRIIVPTEAVKADIEARLQVPAERIDVVPWGVGPEFAVIQDRGRLDEARKQGKLPKRFVLFVGTLEPKKNIEGLIKSFFAAKVHRKLPHSLVLAGRMGWGMKGLAGLIRELNAGEYILFTGRLPDAALPLLYNLADLLVMPSHVEGFGMPVLESMACGCPVVISSDRALQEVAGGAARVVIPDPSHPFQPLRQTLEDLLMDGRTALDDLRAKGFERARMFTWARTANLTRASYQRAMEGFRMQD